MATPNKKKTMDEREVVLAKVEMLMAKGIQRPSIIAEKVKCSVPMASEYMKAVMKRWELNNNIDFSKMRVVLMEKSMEEERIAYEGCAVADNASAKVGYLNTILEIHKFQAWLAGVTRVLEDKK